MSEADALFRLLHQAPPRSAEIVKRVALAGTGLPKLAGLYGVDEAQARVLLFRALLDVKSGGSERVSDADEPAALERLFGPSPTDGEPRVLLEQLKANREELQQKLQQAAAAFETSPDRQRDEWLRYLAIALVLALTAFFFWREQTKPRPPPQKRPTVVAPAAPPP